MFSPECKLLIVELSLLAEKHRNDLDTHSRDMVTGIEMMIDAMLERERQMVEREKSKKRMKMGERG